MLNQFYKTDCMNFFSPTDYFITTVCVNVF